MAPRAVTSAFYTANFLMYIVTVWYDWNYVEIGHRGYAGKFKFLTFWNLILQMVYFGLCVVTIFAGSDASVTSANTKGHSGLQRARDVIHSTLAFPVGTFVVCTFWALYAMDRELVYPKALDSLIPPWLNHLMHTTVLPLLLVEKYLVFHHHPRRRNGIFILVAFALLYLAWILWIAFAADLWVYPVLQVMQNHERAIFIAVLLLFFIGLYVLGEVLTKALWSKERATLTSSSQKLK